MKTKLYALLAMLFIAITTFAQSEGLLMDKPGKDGSRLIGTYYHYMSKGFTDTAPVGLSIVASIKNEDVRYYLSVRMSNVTFPKSGVFLIKTSEGEVIELSQKEDEHKTHSSTYVPNIGLLQQGTGFYPITIETLNAIEQSGITKVRIETTAEVIDLEYKEKQVKKYKKEFSTMLQLIKSSTLQRKDIYSDF